jgi:hypothetical protein
MTTRPIPQRHWRSYGNDPLPTPAEALAEPFRAFPSWFLRIGPATPYRPVIPNLWRATDPRSRKS